MTEYFDIEEIAVITGDSEVGSAFSRLNFDHLIFTGGKSVAKQIIRATSENMVPLTLELGGKSPVIIGKSADLDSSTAKIMMGKTLNAGQICLAPDYVFVHEDSVKDFICSAKTSVSSMFPSLKENPDYTSMINSHHFERIKEYIEDARQKGAEIVEINPIDENFEGQRHFRIPPTLIVEPTDDMKIMQHEVFGPVLSIKKYSTIDEPLNYINAHPSPLALYYFGQDKREQKYVLEHSTSGGVTINDVLLHAAQDDLPFGGVGSSGYGRYHGYEGFKQFSNARSIFTQSKIVSKLAATMWPPHT